MVVSVQDSRVFLPVDLGGGVEMGVRGWCLAWILRCSFLASVQLSPSRCPWPAHARGLRVGASSHLSHIFVEDLSHARHSTGACEYHGEREQADSPFPGAHGGSWAEQHIHERH